MTVREKKIHLNKNLGFNCHQATLSSNECRFTMIGKNSTSKLHVLASLTYVEKIFLHCYTRTSLGILIHRVVAASRRGGLTYTMGAPREITGAIVAIPAYTASASDEGPLLPFSASVAFFHCDDYQLDLNSFLMV